ncbi:MAG: AAA family ATPase [Betaproteobacteria bacterium]|nr:AAA family ATPase [Betaproteobacteria bacterium]
MSDEAVFPILRRYVTALGGNQAFSSAIAKAGFKASARAVRAAWSEGRLPVRDPEGFRRAVNAVLAARNLSPSAAWRRKKNAPGGEVPSREQRTGRSGQLRGDPRQPRTSRKASTMNVIREPLGHDVLRHFGLQADPFLAIPDARHVWTNPTLETLRQIILTAAQRQQILAITGDYGSGKSTLFRAAMIQMLGDPHYRLILPERVDRRSMTATDLVVAVIEELGGADRPIPRESARRDKLARMLLARAAQRGEWPVLAIDEAHDLPSGFFIALKRLWDSGLLFRNLAVIICGSSWTDEKRTHGLRQKIELNDGLKEFAERCQLVDLGDQRKHMPDYLSWRLAQAGASVDQIFEDDAVATIVTRGGTPLLTDNLAARAMREAFNDGSRRVKAVHARHA